MEEENTITSRDHTATTASPPSPSHEFSFTIPLEANTNKAESREPPTAIDLAPADDIFFHGHLLPLHLLNSLPVSPRVSTHSHDGSSLPIRRHNIDTCICNNCGGRTKGHSFNSHEYESRRSYFEERRVKSKSFSVLTLDRRPKIIESKEDQPEKHKWKLRFDVSHFVKKYIRMFTKESSSSREDIQLRKQPYSFSGKLTPTQGKLNLRGRRGEFSAPASMRTSPTNSGTIKPTPPPSSDSTMEELQAAIQAAIAHCKNSSATAS